MTDDYKYITLLDTSTPGTYTVYINEETIAEVAVVGGGGGGVGCAHGGAWYYADGGGGAAFVGLINLPTGTYIVTVGAGGTSNFNPSSASDAGSVTGGDSSLGELIIAGGGIRGSGTNCVYPGAGGTLTVNADVISSTIQSNGNNATGGGTSGHGQAQSLYQDYGKGGVGNYGGSVAGTNGYVKIRIRVLNTTSKFHSIMKREKAYWRNWQQPILTANGTMGGDSFAVSSNVVQLGNADCAVYMAFDNKANTQFHSTSGVLTGYIDWYNPKPLKITNIKITNQTYAGRASTAGKIYGSNNGTDWTLLSTYTNSNQASGGVWNIDLSSNTQAFLYYRLESTQGGSGYWTIGEIDITAKVYDEHYTYKAYGIMQRFIKHTIGDYNPKNVLVIGSPTITEQGVVSSFSASNYVRPTAFKPENNPWEMVWKITTGDDVSGSQCIFATEDTSNQRAGFQLFIVNSKFHIRFMTASNGTSWTFAKDGLHKVLPNTDYYIRASWNGIAYTLEYMNATTNSYMTDVYVSNSNPIYRISTENEDAIGVQMRGSVTSNNFLGSIDLSESYMKVNDEYYWTGFYIENVIGSKAHNIVNISKLVETIQYNYTGQLQTFIVPNGIISIQVKCVAASGKNGTESTGGKGGQVITKMSVTPGETLYIWVGKVPDTTKTAEYNASDIRTSSADITSEEGLNSRLVVAGAGGSGTTVNWIDGNGGNGGGLVGASATNGYGTNPTGGTQTEGGKAGTNGASYGGVNGKAGSFGLGGDAGAYNSSNNGGAGGAGWYGGGSGGSCLGSNITGVTDGLGGAGGSSYTNPQRCTSVSHTQGVNDGNGYISISYTRSIN